MIQLSRPGRLGGAAVVGGIAVVALALPASAAPSNTPVRTWGTNGRVSALVPVGDRVIVAGAFTEVTDTSGADHRAANVAVFVPATGQFDLSWSGSTDGTVNAVAVDGDRVYLGGAFTSVDGQTRRKLAALDVATGELVDGWSPKPNRSVSTVAAFDGHVYVGGPFTSIRDGAGTHPAPYLARVSEGSGAWDPDWRPAPDDRVRKVLPSADDTHVFVAGDFTSVSGAPFTRAVASLSATGGAVDRSFVLGPTNRGGRPPVFDMATDGRHLLLAVGGSGGACTSVSPSSGSVQWSKLSNGNLQAVTISGGTAYCGGHFGGSSSFDGQPRYKAAAVDLTTAQTLPWAPRVNSPLGVWEMAAGSDAVYLGGDFTKISGRSQPHFAMFPN